MPKPMHTVSFKLPPGLRSVTSVADEVTDTIDGPPDLSTHPRHLARYGR